MELPEMDNKHLSMIVIGIISVTALITLGLDAREIAIAGIAAIGGAMSTK